MKTYRYSVPNQQFQGWAILFLDDAGCFSVLSDYGNHAYRWPMSGMPEGDDIRSFVCGIDDGYLLSKIGRREFDSAATEKAIKETIIERRRTDEFDKRQARREWDLAASLGGGETSPDLWLSETEIVEAWELSRSNYPAQVRAFVERVWPRLRELIRAELAAEQKARVGMTPATQSAPRSVVLHGRQYEEHALHCGECSSPMTLRHSARHGRVFYGCSRWPGCAGTHSAHQTTGAPMGTPADAETKLARMAAHAAFDELWKSGSMKRKQAYRWMREALGLAAADAHISRMTKEQCAALVKCVEEREAAL